MDQHLFVSPCITPSSKNEFYILILKLKILKLKCLTIEYEIKNICMLLFKKEIIIIMIKIKKYINHLFKIVIWECHQTPRKNIYKIISVETYKCITLYLL